MHFVPLLVQLHLPPVRTCCALLGTRDARARVLFKRWLRGRSEEVDLAILRTLHRLHPPTHAKPITLPRDPPGLPSHILRLLLTIVNAQQLQQIRADQGDSFFLAESAVDIRPRRFEPDVARLPGFRVAQPDLLLVSADTRQASSPRTTPREARYDARVCSDKGGPGMIRLESQSAGNERAGVMITPISSFASSSAIFDQLTPTEFCGGPTIQLSAPPKIVILAPGATSRLSRTRLAITSALSTSTTSRLSPRLTALTSLTISESSSSSLPDWSSLRRTASLVEMDVLAFVNEM